MSDTGTAHLRTVTGSARAGDQRHMLVSPVEERILMRLRQQPGRRWLLNHAKGTLALVGRDEECGHSNGPVLPTG